MKEKRRRIGADFPPAFKFEEKGDSIKGLLVDRKLVESEEFKQGKAMFYTLETEDGKQHSILGSGLLDWMLKQVKDGERVEIVYLGKEKLPKEKGGFRANRYSVEVIELVESEAGVAA